MTPEKIIRDILEHIFTLQLATIDADGLPWICTVCFAADKKNNLYWFSRHDTHHSRHIGQNPRIAGAVATTYQLGDKAQGLQFFGKARDIKTKDELKKGLAAMCQRYEVSQEREEKLYTELSSGKADYGLYGLFPEKIILHDKKNFPKDPQKIVETTTKS